LYRPNDAISPLTNDLNNVLTRALFLISINFWSFYQKPQNSGFYTQKRKMLTDFLSSRHHLKGSNALGMFHWVNRLVVAKHQWLMEQHALKNVNNCLITNNYSYLETSGGQSSNLYLNSVHFFNTSVNLTLWQLKTAVFLHRCLIANNIFINTLNIK